MSTSTPPGDTGNNSDTTPEDVLATPPVADDITSALRPAKSGRGGPPMMTYVLAAVVLVGAGFLAGTILNKGSDSNTSGFPGGALPSGFPSGALPSGVPGGGAGGGGITFGTVTKVEGDTVYVKQADGTTITVKTNGSTTVQVSTTGTVSDLSPGSTVVVQGSSSGENTVTAQTISEGGFAGAGAGNVPTPVGGSGS
jgi:hypothetical protein